MGNASHSSQSSTPRSDRSWPVDTHNERAHAFTQTGVLASYETRSLTVTSSRGFGREMAPHGATRPALKSRRYTIDVSTATGTFPKLRDFGFRKYTCEPENFSPHSPSRAEQPRFHKVDTSVRETDEPVQRRRQLPLPDPLRHRDLHRWGNVMPPMDGGVYLNVGNATILNEEVRFIADLLDDSWYKDNVLDTGLELISKYHDCEANNIGIANSMVTQCLQFAANITDDGDMSDLKEYKRMFEEKKWIFVALNDGMTDFSGVGHCGNHWALLAIDRPGGSAHYVDGQNLTQVNEGVVLLARSMARAMGNLLGETYQFVREYWAPCQSFHNGARFDGGPCGPYVIKMTEWYVSEIRHYQRQGTEADFAFGLDEDMPEYFGMIFNSYEQRWALLYTLAGAKASQVANDRARAHDKAALGQLYDEAMVVKDEAAFFYDSSLFDRDALGFRQCRKQNKLSKAARGRKRSLSSYSTDSDSSTTSRFEEVFDNEYNAVNCGIGVEMPNYARKRHSPSP